MMQYLQSSYDSINTESIDDDVFCFVSAAHGIQVAQSQGVDVPIGPNSASRLAASREFREQLERCFQSQGPGLVFGALPFDCHQREQLALHHAPHAQVSGQSLTVLQSCFRCTSDRVRVRARHEKPGPAGYSKMVASALDEIAQQSYDKVVLSRALELELEHAFDPSSVLARLSRAYLSGHLFALRESRSQSASWLVGASPELLLSRRGRIIRSMPLAGSVPRGATPSDDEANARRLLESEKDQREHAYVVESIRSRLAPLEAEIRIPERPSLVRTPTMWHLGSEITGTLTGAILPSSLELALCLHPTPAVCGFPESAARAAIERLEGHARGAFCGIVGWNDENGDGEWAVTIRCARLSGETVQLYAGAGIVEGSLPDSEVRETEAKLATMMRALQLDPNES